MYCVVIISADILEIKWWQGVCALSKAKPHEISWFYARSNWRHGLSCSNNDKATADGYCGCGCDVRRSSSDDMTGLGLVSDADDDEECATWWLFRGVVDAEVDVVDWLTAGHCRLPLTADAACLNRGAGVTTPASVPTATASPFGHRVFVSSARFIGETSRRVQLVVYRSTGPAETWAVGWSLYLRQAAGGQTGWCGWYRPSVPQQPAVVALPPLALPLPASAAQ